MIYFYAYIIDVKLDIVVNKSKNVWRYYLMDISSWAKVLCFIGCNALLVGAVKTVLDDYKISTKRSERIFCAICISLMIVLQIYADVVVILYGKF